MIPRGDLLSFGEQDTIIMIVSPDGVCYLVNVDTGSMRIER